eukprot:scaffold54055_cov61-Phaeocystis_antarctica.AAC.3
MSARRALAGSDCSQALLTTYYGYTNDYYEYISTTSILLRVYGSTGDGSGYSQAPTCLLLAS